MDFCRLHRQQKIKWRSPEGQSSSSHLDFWNCNLKFQAQKSVVKSKNNEHYACHLNKPWLLSGYSGIVEDIKILTVVVAFYTDLLLSSREHMQKTLSLIFELTSITQILLALDVVLRSLKVKLRVICQRLCLLKRLRSNTAKKEVTKQYRPKSNRDRIVLELRKSSSLISTSWLSKRKLHWELTRRMVAIRLVS